MWVASYGVIPQTYIRAVPDEGPTWTSCCDAESKARTGREPAGLSSRGTGPELHGCRASPWPPDPGRLDRAQGAAGVLRTVARGSTASARGAAAAVGD